MCPGASIRVEDKEVVTPQQRFMDANDLFEGHLAGGVGTYAEEVSGFHTSFQVTSQKI